MEDFTGKNDEDPISYFVESFPLHNDD